MKPHFCDARLFPGECIVCLGKPRPVIMVDVPFARMRVEVEILGRGPKRTRVRFLADNPKGKAGDVRFVANDAVRMPEVSP